MWVQPHPLHRGPCNCFVKSLYVTFYYQLAFYFLLSSAGSNVQRTPSNRSTASTASSLISLEPIMDETAGDASGTDVTDTATNQQGIEDENR